MTPEQEIQRAREAQRWLDDELFKAARGDVYGQLKAARLTASTTDTLLHSKLILMEQMADRFFGYFEQLAQTGKFAQMQLDDIERQRKGLKERLMSYAQWGRNGM